MNFIDLTDINVITRIDGRLRIGIGIGIADTDSDPENSRLSPFLQVISIPGARQNALFNDKNGD